MVDKKLGSFFNGALDWVVFFKLGAKSLKKNSKKRPSDSASFLTNCYNCCLLFFPMDLITLSDDDWGV